MAVCDIHCYTAVCDIQSYMLKIAMPRDYSLHHISRRGNYAYSALEEPKFCALLGDMSLVRKLPEEHCVADCS